MVDISTLTGIFLHLEDEIEHCIMANSSEAPNRKFVIFPADEDELNDDVDETYNMGRLPQY
jgi:hypothetical protein